MIVGLVKLVVKLLLTIVRMVLGIPVFIAKQILKSPIHVLRFLHPINLTWWLIKTAVQLTLLLIVLALAAYNYEAIVGLVPNPPKSAVFPFESREWTTKPAAGSTDIVPFSVAVSDDVLDDLKKRLSNARYGPAMDNVHFEYGFPPRQLKNVVDYWTRSFNWRKQEGVLNQYSQFKTEIEGLNIHFAQAKPRADAKTTVLPVILFHGFPGSYYELYKLVPLLTQSRAFKTGNPSEPQVNIAFEVVIPSLPGFGFSDSPQIPAFVGVFSRLKQNRLLSPTGSENAGLSVEARKKFGLVLIDGLGTADMARIMHELMTRLGHTGYVVHGGDWGASVAQSMASMYPKSVKGLELTGYMIPMGASFAKGTVALVASRIFGFIESKFPGFLYARLPALKNITERLMDPADYGKIIWNNLGTMIKYSGYFHFQATRPDTVGAGVTDSPAGLAAYILDMFSWCTSPANDAKADGGLKDSFSMDDLLTNVMIYWVNGNVMSGQRLYKEEMGSPNATERLTYVISVPTVLSDFPQEIGGINPPAAFARPYYKKLVDFRRHKSGGHFAGLENPKELSEDIWALVSHFVSKPLSKGKPVKKEL